MPDRSSKLRRHDQAHTHECLAPDEPIEAAQAYLLPIVRRVLAGHFAPGTTRAILDLGCGNGLFDRALSNLGYSVTGIDADPKAIALAVVHNPHGSYFSGSAYDDLAAEYGTFAAMISLEVVEHLYDPQAFARTLFSLLEADGIAVISTPYHGYTKNLLLSLFGIMDRHFTALWRGGHIKFWSVKTITRLLSNAGFKVEHIFRVGRLPPIARSMVIVARKPPQQGGAR